MKVSLPNLLLVSMLFTLPLLACSARAQSLLGVDLAETTAASAQMPKLYLNGYGIRRIYTLVDVYVGALYLTNKSSDAADILHDAGAKRMEFHLLRTISGRQIAERFFDGLQLNFAPEVLQQLHIPIAKLMRILSEQSRYAKGSVARFDYLSSSQEMRIYLDDKLLGVVADKAMYDAILTIWIGHEPVSAEFKACVLGQKRPFVQRKPEEAF